MTHALLVDDDTALRTLLTDYLQRFGVRVTAVPDAAGLRRVLPGGGFDVLLLDLMLPDGNGFNLCRWVRESSQLPIIMLTAEGDPASRIAGLELGADDFLPKPFEPRELVARIQAVLHRRGSANPAAHSTGPVSFNGWTFDGLARQLTSPSGVIVALSGAECRLLAAFVDHPRRLLTRDRLRDLSRPPGSDVNDRAIDLAVSRLRQKLNDSAPQPALIRTERGAGYVFDAEPTPASRDQSAQPPAEGQT